MLTDFEKGPGDNNIHSARRRGPRGFYGQPRHT
jgi:hypothetical protein